MASILEIVNVARQVTVRDKQVDVFGLSGITIAGLMVRFPEIGKMMSGMDTDTTTLLSLAPKALCAVMAAGLGKVGDEATEKAAGELFLQEQVDILDEVLRLTFPRGLGPFAEQLERLGVLGRVNIQSPQASQVQPTNSLPQDTATL